MMSSAQTVRKIRINLCLETQEFAEKLGITAQAVRNYESGLRSPKLSMVRKIRELAKEGGMEIPISEFLGE